MFVLVYITVRCLSGEDMLVLSVSVCFSCAQFLRGDGGDGGALRSTELGAFGEDGLVSCRG